MINLFSRLTDENLSSSDADGAPIVAGKASRSPAHMGRGDLVRGELDVDGLRFDAGEALLLADQEGITLAEGCDAKVLVFDLAA